MIRLIPVSLVFGRNSRYLKFLHEKVMIELSQQSNVFEVKVKLFTLLTTTWMLVFFRIFLVSSSLVDVVACFFSTAVQYGLRKMSGDSESISRVLNPSIFQLKSFNLPDPSDCFFPLHGNKACGLWDWPTWAISNNALAYCCVCYSLIATRNNGSEITSEQIRQKFWNPGKDSG